MKKNRIWQGKVYRKKLSSRVRENSKNWLKIRNKVFERDNYQCKWCLKFFGESGLRLSCHHIKPRKEGGTNAMSNLVSLCFSCHDFIEMNPQMEGELYKNMGLMKLYEETKSKDWRKWVYGGFRKGD